jgi:hypothetical protein
VEQANKRADLTVWFDGIVDGAGLARQDPAVVVSAGDVRDGA